MNGNHARTLKSCIDTGWAMWDGARDADSNRLYEEFANCVVTASGRAAIAAYVANWNKEHQR